MFKIDSGSHFFLFKIQVFNILIKKKMNTFVTDIV